MEIGARERTIERAAARLDVDAPLALEQVPGHGRARAAEALGASETGAGHCRASNSPARSPPRSSGDTQELVGLGLMGEAALNGVLPKSRAARIDANAKTSAYCIQTAGQLQAESP